ncbi:MAG: molybdenum cofactor biosynthesis protein MoaE [Gammaproteobacteria bacterium]|nr:molybdenum cofactor biosynthesis protein MoaE [Gammaproteobacteria bacterium]
MSVTVKTQEQNFDVGKELLNLRARQQNQFGAVVSFVGLVRDSSNSKDLIALEIEHYPDMTESSIVEIVRKAENRWDILDVLVIHRVGRLYPSEEIVLVQVASPHREKAFECCEFIMDYLKTDAIFWKREITTTGSYYVESSDSDTRRKDRWD